MNVKELVKEPRSWADCDARSGEPLGARMRKAADKLEELAAENADQNEAIQVLTLKWQNAEAALAETRRELGDWKNGHAKSVAAHIEALSRASSAEAALAEKDKEIAEFKRRQKELEVELSGVRRSYFAERRARNAGGRDAE